MLAIKLYMYLKYVLEDIIKMFCKTKIFLKIHNANSCILHEDKEKSLIMTHFGEYWFCNRASNKRVQTFWGAWIDSSDTNVNKFRIISVVVQSCSMLHNRSKTKGMTTPHVWKNNTFTIVTLYPCYPHINTNSAAYLSVKTILGKETYI